MKANRYLESFIRDREFILGMDVEFPGSSVLRVEEIRVLVVEASHAGSKPRVDGLLERVVRHIMLYGPAQVTEV